MSGLVHVLMQRKQTAWWSGHPALVQEGGRFLSYHELVDQVEQLGSALGRRYVISDSVVGVALGRSLEHVVGCLACWYAEAAFLAIDLSWPDERIRPVLDEARPASVLTGSEQLSRFRRLGALAMTPDSLCPADPLPRPRNWHDFLAYVVADTDPAGQSRCVEVEQGNVLPMLTALVDAFGLNAYSRCLWVHDPASDHSIATWGACLLAGGTLYVENDERLRDPESFVRLMHDRQITHLDLPPALVPVLSPSRMPDCLRTVVLRGASCPPAFVRLWARSFRVFSVHGPPEATVCSSLCVCDPDQWNEPMVGDALPGVVHSIQDGYLWIGGRCLARGYRSRPGLTYENFVWQHGQRFYRTGERVTRRTGGRLALVAQGVRLLNLHGELVDPNEIALPLCEVPGIRDAAVVLRDGALVAFVSGPDVPSDADIHARLSRTLPASLRPRRIVRLPGLPRAATGWVDYAALAEVALGPVPAAEGTLGVLLDLARELLGTVPDPGASFLEQGGDSLGLLRLVAAAWDRGLSVPPALLASRSLHDVAAFLDGAHCATPGASTAALRDDVQRLAEEIGRDRANNAPTAPPHRPATVLLTGATGFFGSQILLELLRQTEAEVVCLVRASGSRAGQDRLWQVLAARGLSLRTQERRRVGVIAGDVGMRLLGLGESAWEELARRVESVYHAAANVNLVRPYVELCRDNVAGTAEVLRLCAAGRPKWLHHVSALSALAGTFREDDLSAARTLHGGYAQSKYAAEWLLRRGAVLGVTIYRPARIAPDSRGGPMPSHDLLGVFLRGMAALGCLPACDRSAVRLELTPIDFAARALVYLSLNAAGQAFHLAGSRPVTLEELAAALYRAGVDLAEVDNQTWRARLGSLSGEQAAAWLALSRAMPGGEAFAGVLELFHAAAFDQSRTLAALQGTKIEQPVIDGALLDRYVRGAIPPDSRG